MFTSPVFRRRESVALAAVMVLSLASSCAAPGEPSPSGDPFAQLPRQDFSYELPDGRVVVGEGIRLSDDKLLIGGDVIIPIHGDKGSTSKAQVASALWPTRVITYEFDPAVSVATRLQVLNAMEPWKSLGFIFRRRTTQTDFVFITTEFPGVPTYVCSTDEVGHILNNRYHAGADCRTRDFVHEWGHILGLFHEHARADRDQYIIVDDRIRNLEGIGTGASVGSYDFGSIMHYNAFGRFSNGDIDEFTVLIRPVDPRIPLHSFGFNETPSYQDAVVMGSLYGNRPPGIPLYHLYSPEFQDWFYTTDLSQRAAAMQLNYADFGIAARLEAAPQGDVVPFWRFYKGPPQTDHFYTGYESEINTVLAGGWVSERIEGYIFPAQVDGTTALHRFAHWNGATGDLMHYYTVYFSLYAMLVSDGWNYDGVAGYVYPP